MTREHGSEPVVWTSAREWERVLLASWMHSLALISSHGFRSLIYQFRRLRYARMKDRSRYRDTVRGKTVEMKWKTYETQQAHGQRRLSAPCAHFRREEADHNGNKPVRPKTPTLSPDLRVKDRPWSTAGRSGAYWTTRFSTESNASPRGLDGQYAGTRLDSIIARGSWGKSRLITE